ncbi:hypothetical protein INR49_001361 [Caranx melampygus]|nr:hypothetical protein INR49_001361 [Caranx melampygus]
MKPLKDVTSEGGISYRKMRSVLLLMLVSLFTIQTMAGGKNKKRNTNPPSPGQNAPTGAMATVCLATGTVELGLEKGHERRQKTKGNRNKV